MKLTLIRTIRTDLYTAGELFIDGQFFCHTLEDPDRGLRQTDPIEKIRKVKVPGQTAIPTGGYEVRFTYSPRFKREMLQVMDVPGFEGIRIHAGNTARDTEGCILLGDKGTQPGTVIHSRQRVAELEQLLRGKEWIRLIVK